MRSIVLVALGIGIFACSMARSAEPDRNPAGAENGEVKRPTLPPQIIELKTKLAVLQGRKPAEAQAIIEKLFGKPTRSIGSGILIPQWDIAGGALTAHPFQGPTYAINGTHYWLIDTQNLVGANLVGSYEMTTVADPNNHGNRFWIGNIELSVNGTYHFVPSGSNQQAAAPYASSFLFQHPKGKFALRYPADVSAATVLEKVEDHALLATIDFSADDRQDAADGKFSMSVRADVTHRRLFFASADDKPLNFELEKGWEQFWK